MINDEAKKELNKIIEIEKTIDREKLVYKASEHTYNFRNVQTIKTFDKNIYDGTYTLTEANEYQTDLLVEIMNFKKTTKPLDPQKKTRKKNCS